jgi:FixJ family two-component response regulator
MRLASATVFTFWQPGRILIRLPSSTLFTDINLPDGPDAMDGLELARQAVELRPRLRVIYTTGGGRTDGMSALFVDGGIFLPKPYRTEQLIQATETASGSTTSDLPR